MLHEGLNFPEEGKKLTNVQTINGAEVQWALGALIYRTRYLPLRFVLLFQAEKQNIFSEMRNQLELQLPLPALSSPNRTVSFSSVSD